MVLGVALASNYYVAPNGLDTNDCSLANPCKTISYIIDSKGPSGSSINVSLAAGSYGPENCHVFALTTSNFTYSAISINGPAGTVLSAAIDCKNTARHFSFDVNNTVVTISYLILQQGTGGNGGCVLASALKNLTLQNVQLTECTASNGAALYSSVPTYINSSIFTFNQAGSNGGALFLESLTNGSSIVNSNFSFNTAGAGAAVYLYGDYLYFTNSLVFNNTAFSYGGGLYISTPTPKKKGTYNFMGSNFTNNNASLQGAGVYAENLNHTWNIFGALFIDNWSTGVNGDSNIGCGASAPEFCYACTAKDCVNGCATTDELSCSQNTTSNQTVLCYGAHFAMCKDSSCKCKTIMTKVEKILIVIIALLLVVGIVLITVDVARYVLKKRQQNSTYTPIK